MHAYSIKTKGHSNCCTLWDDCDLGLIELLLQASRLAGAIAHEVEIRTTDMCVAFYNNLVYARGAQKEGSFNAYAIAGNPANCEIAFVTTFAHADYHSFKFLNALAITFFNADMNADGIARIQLRDIRVDGGFYSLHQISHFLISLLFYRSTAFLQFFLDATVDYITNSKCGKDSHCLK
jgi:hypothetical protein